jgi:hypothetical protein
VALLLALLCAGDALYTLLHVSAGAIELNPLMNILLKKGPFIFFGAKFTLSACAIILLVLYRHYPPTRVVIICIVAIYAALFCYHIFLFFSWPF